jgi:molybdenum cofactor synthesis domain-containing protein
MSGGAALIVIGNEILSGKVEDQNGPFLIRELRELGVSVHRLTVIPDDVPAIAEEVRRSTEWADHVITSGGVGPTLDDLTMEGVAAAFALDLVSDTDLEAAIRAHFGERTLPSHLEMARIPEGAILHWTEARSWPVVTVGKVVILPGDPPILRRKFLGVRERFRDRPFHLRRLFTSLDEGTLAPVLDAVHRDNPGVALGSYPVSDHRDYQVQVTLESRDAAPVERALRQLRDALDPE